MITLSINEAMQKYFQMREKAANEGLDFLFKTPVSHDEYLVIYEGSVDEDECISWKPVKMTAQQDFTSLENEFNITFHQTIVDYFNAYWFAELDGFYKEYYITLEPVLSNIQMNLFGESLRGYKNNHEGLLKNIPIGMEGNGLVVVIENMSGIISLEDFERGTFEYLAQNIQELIENLRLKR